MKPNRVTEPIPLLDDRGRLTRPGWATSQQWRYDRRAIKAPWYRIKEWDYYYVLDQDEGHGITFTFSDLGYIGLFAVCRLDLKKGVFRQMDSMSILPRGRTNFPPDSEAGVSFADGKLEMRESVENGKRVLEVNAPGFAGPEGEQGLTGRLVLHQDPNLESMVIATSWKENPRAFYYNQKINCMPAEGEITLGTKRFVFKPETSFGGLDWGRGRWTYANHWFWSSASGLVQGRPFGFNLGYGFSDRSPASENMLFYENRAHKLGEVVFEFDEKDYMREWRLRDDEGRLNLKMTPAVDRNSAVNFLVIKSIQHQVFGYFSGEAVLDDGTRLRIENLAGFAEDVLNRW